jgi:hypothetical protein
MTKSEYAESLLDSRWQEVRSRIIKRDKYTCTCCKKTNVRINVHHEIYLEGKMPWEVPDRFLKTLCDDCHAKAHEGRLISSFIKKTLPTNKPPKRVNNKAKKQVVLPKYTPEERKVLWAKLLVVQKAYPNNKMLKAFTKPAKKGNLSRKQGDVVNDYFEQFKKSNRINSFPLK